MTNRPQAAGLVAVFLRDSLAGGALAVTELDARARAAGLLGERQSITTAKVFKRAKKSLGIRSLRAGFGARSQWRWCCAPKRPLDYLGSAGLVWAINGGRLLELHRDWAVIPTQEGALNGRRGSPAASR
jgi:hypothetical protein